LNGRAKWRDYGSNDGVRKRWGAGFVAVITVAALGCLPSVAGAEPTCTDTWTGGAGNGLWQSAGNWSTASVPGSSDVACIGSGTSVQVTTGSDHAGVLEDSGSLTISGGSLELTSSATASSVASLSMQGGALTGAGSLHVSGSLSWTKAATMSGTGSTVLQSGASGTIELATGEKATLEGRAFVNEGTLTFATGTIAMSAGARIASSGTFRANSETTTYGSQIEVPSGSGGTAPSFVNTGTFEKTAGTGTTTIGVVFEQDGTVTAHTGHFSFVAGEVQQAPQGNWEGSVGSVGYVLAAWDGSSEDSSYLPGVTMSLLQGNRFSWAQETSETRALEGPSGSLRNAGTFYSESEVKVRLSFAASYSGDLRLYAVDWDTTARRESITVEDGSGSRTVPLNNNFHEGAWVSLPVSVAAAGTVTITADRLAGSNAVLSGIFLGDEGTPPGPTVASEPQGNWSGTVGSAGYLLPDWDGSQDVSNMPGVTPELVQGSRYRWEPGTSDTRALEGPEGSSLRNASTFYDSSQLQFQLSFSKAYTGNLHLYAVDWNTTERRELITVDGQTAVLSSNFHGGAWVSFPISVAAAGTVTITVDRLAGSNAVLSGIFLGDAGAPPAMPVASAPKGNWVGAFGTNGYDLFAWNESTDLASLPSESVSLAQGSRYRWTSSTTETQALESPEGSTRRAAALYDPNHLALQLEFTAAYTGELNLYALDWDHVGRRELVTVDGQTADLSSDFSAGAWMSFPISVPAGGVVPITVDRLAGSNAVLSGVFLGTAPPTNTTAPAISGTAHDGQTLSANPGEWSGAPPLSYSYQWQSCNTGGGECTNIEGATGRTYTLGSGNLETTLRVVVTAANSRASTQATSAASAKVEPGAPSELQAPSISGDPNAGHTLHAYAGAWGGTETTVSYQWEHCNSTGGECASIAGATSSEYKLGEGQIGTTLRLRVGVGNSLGSVTAASATTEVIGDIANLMNNLAPSIGGTPSSGQTLTAKGGSWSGLEAISYAYQWESCNSYGGSCKNIEGATASTYVLGVGNIGNTLRVRVSASETSGTTGQTSIATQSIAAEKHPVSEGAPAVFGTGLKGQVLTGVVGKWSNESSIAYSYQWDRCNASGESCSAISGATASTYTLTESDVASTLRMLVTATNESGSTTATSAATAVISRTTLVNVVAPSITGTHEIGRTLSADRGIWTGEGALAYTYKWERCNEKGESCTVITGAAEASYIAASADVGKALRVVVTAEGTAGKESVNSVVTPVIGSESLAPTNLFAPIIEGNLTSGETLTAQTGTWVSSETISYSYQWQTCTEEGECKNITGATSGTYKLIEANIGLAMRVIVTAKNSLGTSSAESEQSEIVGGAGPPANTVSPVINGRAKQSERLVAGNGSWSGSRPLIYYYRWERCNSAGESCISIESATKPSYTVASADVGSTLRVKVTAKNSLSSAGAISTQTTVVVGGEVGATSAIELAEKTDPSVLQPAIADTIEGQEIKPAISDTGESLSDTAALTNSSVSKETPGEFAVNTPAGELSFQPVNSVPNATKTPTIVNGAVAVFAGTSGVTDTIVRPDALGATTLLQLHSSSAPTSFSWEIGLGPNQKLEKLSDGDVAVVEVPSTSPLEGSLGEGLASEHSEATAEHEGSGESGEAAEGALEEGISGEGTLEKLSAAPTASTPMVEPKSGELHPQEAKVQYETAKSTVTYAEEHTTSTMLMVIEPPKVMDAKGNIVSSSLSEEGSTITGTISPGGGTNWPVTAEFNVAAPSNAASAAKASKVRYGLSDPKATSFEDSEEVAGKTEPYFDKHVKEGMHVGIARDVIPYTWHPSNPELIKWLEAVKSAGLQPFITLGINASQMCHPGKHCVEPQISSYEKHIKALIAGVEALSKEKPTLIPAVTLWGAWNEPDLLTETEENPLQKNPKRAAMFWKKAHSILSQVGCSCTMLAGEFAEDDGYIEKYVAYIKNNHSFGSAYPHTWGLHDYHDLENYYNHPYNSYADRFVEKIGKRLKNPRIWFSEQGVALQNGEAKTNLDNNSEGEDIKRQLEAAKDFQRLSSIHLAKEQSRVEVVNYYLYKGPSTTELTTKPHAFDSALLPTVAEEEGHPAENPRPAYCVLALGLEGCPAKSATHSAVTSSITSEGGAVSGIVNPNGLATKYLVEYGTTEAYGKVTTATTLPTENGTQSVTATLGGLASCTTYHYQVEAENKANEEEKKPGLGGDKMFRTGGCLATAISSGSSKACALLSGGEVNCWGANFGTFGNGGTENSLTSVSVNGISNAIAISSGDGDTCALLAGGKVDCWGYNYQGQLGNGTTENSSVPVAVSGITNAIAIAAGGEYACALLSGGSVKCWGFDSYGALGNGETPEHISTPVAVTGITNATAIAAGNQTCALISGGNIKCWGYNYRGTLGNGTHENSSTPVSVTGITNATAIDSGYNDVCAVLSTGRVNCWGANNSGELGNGTNKESDVPVEVTGITNATQVTARSNEVCALLSTGSIKCWGNDEVGQLGDGIVTGESETPVAVTGITNATAVSGGVGPFTCALLNGGSIDCWGENQYGVLGNGTTHNSSIPVSVIGYE
jgi:alpha-tubulin suppressor-like RCC1 family protein